MFRQNPGRRCALPLVRSRVLPFLAVVSALVASSANAASVTLKDPSGDDKGPGSYVYPTKDAYRSGDFDLTEVTIKEKGNKIEISVTVNAKIRDVWNSAKWPSPGNGFSVQMFQIYADTDGKKGSGHKKALPGMNANFAPESQWEKVFLISPQSNKRLTAEVKQKAAKLRQDIILPTKVSVRGKKIVATFRKKDLGTSVKKIGWQVLASSNEGYPAAEDFLSRKVNEFEGGDRFGGGSDDNSDPHFLDCLAGSASGSDDEAKAQFSMLKFAPGKKATLKMIRQ